MNRPSPSCPEKSLKGALLSIAIKYGYELIVGIWLYWQPTQLISKLDLQSFYARSALEMATLVADSAVYRYSNKNTIIRFVIANSAQQFSHFPILPQIKRNTRS